MLPLCSDPTVIIGLCFISATTEMETIFSQHTMKHFNLSGYLPTFVLIHVHENMAPSCSVMLREGHLVIGHYFSQVLSLL